MAACLTAGIQIRLQQHSHTGCIAILAALAGSMTHQYEAELILIVGLPALRSLKVAHLCTAVMSYRS